MSNLADLPAEQLAQLAEAIGFVLQAGYGEVTLIVSDGRPKEIRRLVRTLGAPNARVRFTEEAVVERVIVPNMKSPLSRGNRSDSLTDRQRQERA